MRPSSWWLPGALVLAVACGGPELAPDEVGPVEVSTWLEGASAAGGVLVVQTVFDPKGEVELPVVEVPRLEVQPLEAPDTEQIGEREVVTQRYRFTGAKGSYEIPALQATWTAPDAEPVVDVSSPLFVDMGVEAPPREIADIEEPGRVFTVPWRAVAAVGGVGGLMIAGLWLALRGVRHRPVAEVPPEPPDLAALRRWDAVRADDALSNEEKAQALSLLFREYVEAVLTIPATKWTTTEILAQLGEMRHLPEGNVPRARRLLRATDRVKYADARVAAELFEDLDADLRAFVGSTRPQRWESS